MIKPLIAAGLAGMLAGCITAGLQGPDADSVDWVTYGSSVRDYDAAELEREYLSAAAAHQSAPSSATAIRLALLACDPRSPYHDRDRALALLEGVAPSPSAAPADVAFAQFMRGVVAELAALDAALDAQDAERRSLREQLDALIALEERLNAEDAEP
jgi:hypothetical protein